MEREKANHYSEALKQEVSAAIKAGMSYQQACVKYGIRAPSTIFQWVKNQSGVRRAKSIKPKGNQAKEPETVSRLEREKRELELALSRMSLKVHSLEVMIEEAGKHYKEDLKKKFIQQ